ncbi:XRE family transcriptional regulator [Bacillus sp. FJAT-50079]|uniref:LexA family protein n=1 Tax=Bacillus sp. FJAT-50079 TaxID=2833577 RepID=UPI001BCA5A7C|nr:XRE family transcriptional regulator [Bacillus sp. FJAT-50079]MBS4210462.1 helix-turn-helix domain-containing protein [Bacillus sp. FJAT-50079]
MKEDITLSYQRKVLSNNIQRFLDKRGITQTDMARDIGVAETTVSSWMLGKRYPGLKSQQRLADYFNVKRSDLTEESSLNLVEVSPQTVKIPVLGVIACHDSILAKENIIDYRYESPDDLPSGALYYLEAKGDSMEPKIPDGSLVLIREQSEVESGEIAAVLVNRDEEASLKKVTRQGGMVLLMPLNSSHEPILITEDNPALIIGKAVEVRYRL